MAGAHRNCTGASEPFMRLSIRGLPSRASRGFIALALAAAALAGCSGDAPATQTTAAADTAAARHAPTPPGPNDVCNATALSTVVTAAPPPPAAGTTPIDVK